MLEEILALVLSLFSLVTNETPRVSLRETDNTQDRNTDDDRGLGNTDDDRWLLYINEEYENVSTGEQLSSVSYS